MENRSGKPRDTKPLRCLVMISQIGISMMVPIFLCLFLGIALDKAFETSFWVIIFVFLGVLASFRNVYLLTKRFYAKDKAKEDAELKYFEDLKKAGKMNMERRALDEQTKRKPQ